MKFKKINVESVLNYDEFELDLEQDSTGLHVLYGPNETGKSTLLQILIDLLFGGKIENQFKNHYKSGSKISGIIEANNESIELSRKKKRTKLELYEQSNLTEEELIDLLGGYDKEQFKLLFGFDHERLREGGESLLQSDGQAGISLFETGGGLQHLQNLLQELEERSKELLDPSFRKTSIKKINSAWKAYNKLSLEIESSGLRGEDYHRLRTEITESKKRVKDIQNQKNKLMEEIAKLQRIKRVREFVNQLLILREQFAEFKNPIELPTEIEERIKDILTRYDQTLSERNRVTELIKQIKTKIDEKEIDTDILQNHEKIEFLYQELRQYETRKHEEIPQGKLAIEDLKARINDQLLTIAPNLSFEEINRLRLPITTEEYILQLSEEIKNIQLDIKNEQDRLDEIEDDLSKKEKQVELYGKPKEVSRLKSLIAQIRNHGDLDEAIERKQDEIKHKKDELNTILNNQSLWNKSLEELEKTVLPLNETIEQFKIKWESILQSIQEQKNEIKKINNELRFNKQELEKLDVSGKVPVEEDLYGVRNQRNLKWESIQKTWLENKPIPANYKDEKELALAFEESMNEADHLVDRMRNNSEASARKAHLQLNEKHLLDDLKIQEDELDHLEHSFEELRNQWQKEWDRFKFEAKSPSEMKEWISTCYRPLIEGIKQLQSLNEEHAKLINLKKDYSTNLVEELTSLDEKLPSFLDGFKAVLEYVENFINQAEQRKIASELAMKDVQDANEKLTQQTRKLEKIHQNLEEKLQEWKLLREKHPDLPVQPEIASKYITELRSLFNLVSELRNKQKDLERKITANQKIEQLVNELANLLQETDISSTEDYIRKVQLRLSEANNLSIEKNQLNDNLNEYQDELININTTIMALEEQINRFKERYNCSDETELMQLVENSKEYRELKTKIQDKEQAIFEVGDQLPIEQIIKEVREMPNEVILEAKLKDLINENSRLETTMDEENNKLWKLEHEFNQYDGSQTDAADIAQKAESHVTELDQYWNEYLRVELASRLLQRAIDMFREQNESSILERAGRFFRMLTLGNYQQLSIEYEGTEPFIEAIRNDGARRRVNQMSDGTRDQLFLSLRLAFLDQHFEQAEPLPLIMDDILVNFDDERSKAALEVLAEIAQKTQVLYFTHHKSIVDTAESLGNDVSVVIHDLAKYKKLVTN